LVWDNPLSLVFPTNVDKKNTLIFEKSVAVYFASNHKFVRAISVCKSDSGIVLEQSHLEAVVGSVFVVGLVEGPGEVVREGEDVGPRAPAPLPLAPFLRRSRPVVEVVGPIS